jgi:hypothetical protein
MSVKTPVFNWDVPVLGEEANVPADMLSLATEIENTLKVLEPKFLKTAGAGDAGKLLIVGATGAPAFSAMSGDATITNAGVLTVGAEKISTAKIALLAITEALLAGEAVGSAKVKDLAITAAKLAEEAVETIKIKNLAVTEAKIAALAVGTAKLAELAVTEAKIADGAVTSRKYKPTVGLIESTSNLELAVAFADVPGVKLEITPAVASILRVTAVFELEVGCSVVNTEVQAIGTISLDGVDQTRRATHTLKPSSVTTVSRGTHPQVYHLPLTAALHTIKMRASKILEAGAATCYKTHTAMMYELVAS